MNRTDKNDEFSRLIGIMEKLRSENGCEWDKKQTRESLKPYAIEEAYEVAEAIENGDVEELKGELGDLLLQTVFHSQIARENGEFDIYEVLHILNEKLIRRHPHVFKDPEKYSYSYAQWEDIKASEKGKKKKSRIGKINSALPALSMARRIQENAAEVGFDWPDFSNVLAKVDEELDELKVELNNPVEIDEIKTEEEIGDLFFAITNLSRHLFIDPENALRKATKKFINRFVQVEKMVEEEGLVFEETSLEKLDEYWEKVKKNAVQAEQ